MISRASQMLQVEGAGEDAGRSGTALAAAMILTNPGDEIVPLIADLGAGDYFRQAICTRWFHAFPKGDYPGVVSSTLHEVLRRIPVMIKAADQCRRGRDAA